MNIQPNETKITGQWVLEDGKLVADASTRRIEQLVKDGLVEIWRSEDGWSILYLDKTDGRYWELSYPDSEQHGGGAPCLQMLSKNEAVEKFKISK